jgi:hypothetical protein
MPLQCGILVASKNSSGRFREPRSGINAALLTHLFALEKFLARRRMLVQSSSNDSRL